MYLENGFKDSSTLKKAGNMMCETLIQTLKMKKEAE
jgi:hypothetical protein